MPKASATRRHTVHHEGKAWELAFTDGSLTEDKTRADGGLFVPDGEDFPNKEHAEYPERYSSSTTYERVDGPQTNPRAEATAMLAALELKAKNSRQGNLMIVTDSETTIKNIARINLAKKEGTLKKVMDIKNRDILSQIDDQQQTIEKTLELGEVRYLHIYSHQNELDPRNP